MTAPTIAITPPGVSPTKDVARVISRIQNIKIAIAKPTIKDVKRDALIAELDGLSAEVDGLKKALSEL